MTVIMALLSCKRRRSQLFMPTTTVSTLKLAAICTRFSAPASAFVSSFARRGKECRAMIHAYRERAYPGKVWTPTLISALDAGFA